MGIFRKKWKEEDTRPLCRTRTSCPNGQSVPFKTKLLEEDLKKMFASLFLCFALGVYAQDPDLFESITLDFKVTKPSDWQFLSAEANQENLKNIKFEDQEYKELVQKYATVPLVVITKYPEPFDDLNPSLKVNIRPLGQFKGMDPKEMLDYVIPQFKNIFQDLEIIQPPMDTKVSNLPAAYMRVNYLMENAEGRTFPTTSELWIVIRGDYYFMIGQERARMKKLDQEPKSKR